jgi:hypothetical protein
MATQITRPTGPVELPGHESTNVLTLTKHQAEGQAIEQYHYDPAVIDQAVMLGDMKKMSGEMRLAFYRAVCLSVGVNPLTQPFTPLERQDKTIWLYANSTCAQQLAKIHRVTFTDVKREFYPIADEPMYQVTVTVSLPDGRSVPSLAVTSLTKKKKVQKGQWPDGNPKFVDALDEDGEPLLVRLRGEGLANAIKRTDTQAFRRGTLALVGLGWVQSDYEGQPVHLNLQTGELAEPSRLSPPVTRLASLAEQAKSLDDHIEDLTGTRPQAAVPRPASSAGAYAADYVVQLEALLHAQGGDLAAFWAWGERQKKKPQAQFTEADYADLLTRAQSQVQKRTAAKAQESHQEATTGTPDALQTVSPSVAAGDWRGMLHDLLPSLEDATLAQEAASTVEDAEVSEADGEGMLQRVMDALDRQDEAAGAPF